MSALTMSELQGEFERNRRRMWRAGLPLLGSSLVLLAIADGVRRALGQDPAGVFMVLAALAAVAGLIVVSIAAFRQQPIRFEISRRMRSARP
jgi:hypothetical protein